MFLIQRKERKKERKKEESEYIQRLNIYPNQCQKDFGMVGRDYIECYVSTCEIEWVSPIKRCNRIKNTANISNIDHSYN